MLLGPGAALVGSRVPKVQEPTPDDLRRAVTVAAGTLAAGVDLDWSVNAGDLEWTCRETLDHNIDGLIWYAANLATLSTESEEDLRDGDPRATVSELLSTLVASGHILARVAEASPPDARGFHGAGMADVSGFMAMGCDETLVHSYDSGRGLGIELQPPADLCATVVARLFPWAPAHDDPWQLLLWCNGRMSLPGYERIGPGWGWWCRPLDEWDGVPYTNSWPGD
jgi:hypothetical protein